MRPLFVDCFRRGQRFSPQSLDVADTEPAVDDGWCDDKALELSNGVFDAALGRLRPEERAVLYLSAVEGLSAQKIGDLLAWPRGTVLSLLHRTKAKVRTWIESEPRFHA